MTDKAEGTLSAKQVATRIGTDAKTFRRFLRSKGCTIEPVGQGGRYEFGAGDIAPLKAQFEKWRKPGAASSAGTSEGSTPKPRKPGNHSMEAASSSRRKAAEKKPPRHEPDILERTTKSIAQLQREQAEREAVEELEEEELDLDMDALMAELDEMDLGA